MAAGGCSASSGAQSGREVPFPQPIRSAREAGSRLAPLPLTGRVLPGCTCRSLPGTRLPAGFPKWDVAGPVPRCWVKLSSPGEGDRDGAPGVSQAHENQISHPLPLISVPGNSMALRSGRCPQFSPIPRSSACQFSVFMRRYFLLRSLLQTQPRSKKSPILVPRRASKPWLQ